MMVDWPQFAQECVNVLVQRLQRPMEPYAEVLIPTTLVVRGSCGSSIDTLTNPPSSAGVEIRIGPRWKVQQDYLQIRSDSSRQSPVTPENPRSQLQ